MSKNHVDPVILPSNTPMVSSHQGHSFRVVRLLGRGTMSSVYLAEQLSMARPVALKILSPALAGDPEFVQRFTWEARASARLNHPNIVHAIDFGEFESRFFLAMEFIDGLPLSEMISLEEKRVVSIGLQVLAALEHANQHNVIHLDVKPANIMICKDGTAKLADFGLAMIIDAPGVAEASRKAVGTPYYMAPEQVEGGHLDWRTDQYSLGASLYEAVTGVKPFQGKSVSDILVKRFFDKPEPAWKVGKRQASKAFSAVLAKMMSRSPDGRYQSFEDLRSDLERIAEGKKPAIAKMSLIAPASAPSSSSFGTLDYGGVIARVNAQRRRRRLNWTIYSCLLFICLLMAYSIFHAREILGPTPPKTTNYDALNEAEHLPPNVAAQVRENWIGATKLLIRLENDPSDDNLVRALYALRMLASRREFAETAQVTAARRRVAQLEQELRRRREANLLGGEETE